MYHSYNMNIITVFYRDQNYLPINQMAPSLNMSKSSVPVHFLTNCLRHFADEQLLKILFSPQVDRL